MANHGKRTMYGANLGAQVSPPDGGDSGGGVTTGLTHHQASVEDVALPQATDTDVLAIAEFTPEAGQMVQLTGIICYACTGQTLAGPNGTTQLNVTIRNNGGELIQFDVVLIGRSSGEPEVFDYATAIPVLAYETADGNPSNYTIGVETDADNDGTQVVVSAKLIANVLAA